MADMLEAVVAGAVTEQGPHGLLQHAAVLHQQSVTFMTCKAQAPVWYPHQRSAFEECIWKHHSQIVAVELEAFPDCVKQLKRCRRC